MSDPFSAFSKGKVICKYQLVEHVGDHKLRGNIAFVMLLVWVVGWLSLLRSWPGSWVPIVVALFPFVIGNWLFKMAFPYRVIGMVEFKDGRLNIIADDGPPRSMDLRSLRSMRIGLSIAKDFVVSAGSVRVQRAYRLQIKGADELIDLHCLNALHLTKEDELQFMSPPPNLIATLGTVHDTFKIRFYDLRGKESSLV